MKIICFVLGIVCCFSSTLYAQTISSGAGLSPNLSTRSSYGNTTIYGTTSTMTNYTELCAQSNGIDQGCPSVCSGDSLTSYIYKPIWEGYIDSIIWLIPNTSDITVVSETNDSVILKFENPNPLSNTVHIKATPYNSCVFTDTITFAVHLETDCYKIDMNRDDTVTWVGDATAMLQGNRFLDNNAHITIPSRMLPCSGVSLYSAYPQIYPHTGIFIPITNSANSPIADIGRLDPNGDGDISFGTSTTYNPYDPLPNNPMDVEILAHHVAQRTSYDRYTLKSSSNFPERFYFNFPNGSFYENGDQLVFELLAKDSIENIAYVILEVDIELGIYNNPDIDFINTNIAIFAAHDFSQEWIDSTSKTSKRYIALQVSDLDNDLAPHQKLCVIDCLISGGGLWDEKIANQDTTNVEIRLSGASIIYTDGSAEFVTAAPDTFQVIDNKFVEVSPFINLEGAFDPLTGEMNTPLQGNGLLPLKTPYTGLGYIEVQNNGFERIDSTILANTSAVDYVFIEVRDSAHPDSILKTEVGLLLNTGKIVRLDDGVSSLKLEHLEAGYYHLAIKHYNHLGIMTGAPVYLDNTTATILDFTDGSIISYGGLAAMKQVGGEYVLIAGDANGDGAINAIDKNNYFRLENGLPYLYGVTLSDWNLDGTVNAFDLNTFWRINNSLQSFIP